MGSRVFALAVESKGERHMNTDISRSAPASSALPERAALRAQLEETRMAFHALVEALTEAQWHSKTATTAWTVCDVLTHLADGLARLPDELSPGGQAHASLIHQP